MNIIASIIRTFFIDQSLEILFEKLYWNMKVAPNIKALPKNREELIEHFKSGRAEREVGLRTPMVSLYYAMDLWGVNELIERLAVMKEFQRTQAIS